MKKRYVLIWGLGVVLFNLLVLFIAGNDLASRMGQYTPISVRIIPKSRLKSNWSVKVKDIDQDGIEEFIYTYIDSAVPGKVVVGAEEIFEKRYIPHNFLEIRVPRQLMMFDTTWDRHEQKVYYWFLDIRKYPFTILVMSGHKHEAFSIPLEPLSLKQTEIINPDIPIPADLDQDGHQELVLIYRAGYERYPRGVVVYDLMTGKRLWEYYLGSMPHQWIIKDIDNDGRLEIIVGTFAPLNGAVANGISDSRSYVFVLNSDGTLRWIKLTGYGYSRCFINLADLDNDHTLEVIAALDSHHAPVPEPGKLCIFNGKNGKTIRCIQDPRVSFSDPYVFEMNGRKRIIVGDSDGNLRLFDAELHEIKRVNVNEPVRVINRDNALEIWPFITVLSPTRVLFFNESMKPAYTHRFEREIFDLRGSRTLYTIHAQPRCAFIPTATQIALFCERPVSKFAWFMNSLKPVHFLFLCLFLIGNAAFFTHYRWIQKPLKQALARERKASNQWVTVLQEIVHQMKSPLATLLWTIERLQKKAANPINDARFHQWMDSMLEDVYRLRSMIHRLMDLFSVDKPEQTDLEIVAFVRCMAQRYAELLEDRIRVDIDASGQAVIQGNPALLEEALGNLFDNAIEAMPDGGILRVTVTPIHGFNQANPREIIIEIEDTGHGIAPDQLEHVFDPHYSTKREGMGLGLTIARRIIEAHGGRIRIQSREGFGTRVVIRLPVTRGA